MSGPGFISGLKTLPIWDPTHYRIPQSSRNIQTSRVTIKKKTWWYLDYWWKKYTLYVLHRLRWRILWAGDVSTTRLVFLLDAWLTVDRCWRCRLRWRILLVGDVSTTMPEKWSRRHRKRYLWSTIRQQVFGKRELRLHFASEFLGLLCGCHELLGWEMFWKETVRDSNTGRQFAASQTVSNRTGHVPGSTIFLRRRWVELFSVRLQFLSLSSISV